MPNNRFATSSSTLVNIDAMNAVCQRIFLFGRYLYSEKNISAMKMNEMTWQMLYSTAPMTSFLTPICPSTTSPFVVARAMYALSAVYATSRREETTVI